MQTYENRGFDPEIIDEYKSRIASTGKTYVLDQDDENTDEYVHFYFIGKFEGKDAIYDTVIYTLRLHHESELYETHSSKRNTGKVDTSLKERKNCRAQNAQRTSYEERFVKLFPHPIKKHGVCCNLVRCDKDTHEEPCTEHQKNLPRFLRFKE